jgi:hypothetical protein
VTTFSEIRESEIKTPIVLIEIDLDQCEYEYGSAPCAASGGNCYHTYDTCEDKEHYLKSPHTWKFTGNDGPIILGACPYLKDWHDSPTEIRDQEHSTRRQKVTLKFYDDAPLPLAVPNKTTSPAESAGTFWKNLRARNRYYPKRQVRVKKGYEGMDEADFETVYKGLITNWNNHPGRAEIETKDLTVAFDKKIPVKISDDNVLTQVYNGGSYLYPVDITRFPDSGTLKLENEIVTWAGRDDPNERLTGCTAGAYGTTPVSHAVSTKINIIEAFGDPSDGSEILAAECVLELFYRGGLDMLDLSVKDLGHSLNGAISDSASSITLTGDMAKLYEFGYCLRINDELIKVSYHSGQVATVSERGAYGTTASAHSDTDPVYVTEPDFEFERWLTGCTAGRIYEEATKVKEMLEEFRSSTGLRVWQDETCKIRTKLMAPPFYDVGPEQWLEGTNITDDDQFFNGAEIKRITRGVIYYAPTNNKPGEDSENYEHYIHEVMVESESSNAYGEAKPIEIFAPWLSDKKFAVAVVSRFIIRYSPGAGTLKLKVGEKDSGVNVGDFIKVTSSEMLNPDGTPRELVLMEVLWKKPAGDNYEYLLIDTRLDRHYPVIAPASVTYDWDSFSDEEKNKYGCIGDSDNKVGAAKEDGGYIY